MDSGNFRPPNPGQSHSREQQALQEHIDPILNLLRGNNPRQPQQQQPRGHSSSNAINSSPGWHEQQQHGLGSSHGAPPASDYESISDKGNLLHQQQDQRRQQQQQQHIAQAHSQHSTRAELEQAVQFANNKHQHQARAQPPSINSNSNTNNQANQDRSQHASYHQLPSVASALLGSMRSQSEQQLTPSGGGGNWPISPTCLLAAAGHHHHHHHHQALHAHNPALYGNPHAPAPSPSSSCANSPASVGDIYAHQQQQQHIHRVFQSMLHGGHQAAAQQQLMQQRQVLRDSSSGSTTTAAQALQLPSHLLPAHLPPVATPFDLYSTLQSYAALTHTYMSRGAFGSALAMTSSAPGLLHHLPSATVAALQGTFPAVAAQTPSALPAPANIGDSETLLATNAAANDDDNDMLDDDDDDDEDDDDDDRTIKRGHNCQDHHRNRRHSQAARVGPLESVARTRANLFETKRQQHHRHHASGTSLEACTMSAPPAIAHNRASENVEQLSPRFAAGARSNSLRGVASTATIRESHQHSSLGRATGRNSSPPRLTMPTFRAAGKGVGARQSNSGDDDESTTRVVSRTYQRDQNKQAREYNDDTTTDDDVKMSSISIDDDDNDNDEDGDNNANRDKQKDKEGARGDEQKVRDDDAFGGGSSGSTPCNSGRIRTAYSSMQILNLEREFAQNMYLSRIRRIELAQKLSLSEKQVKIWFQNRRVKYKKENPA